jgi:hypothetical protein
MDLAKLDGGFMSRKLLLTLATMLMIVGVAMLCVAFPVLIPLFDTIVGGLMGLAGLYLAGNISSRWVNAKRSSKVSFAGEQWDGATKPATSTPAKPPVQKPIAHAEASGQTEEGS